MATISDKKRIGELLRAIDAYGGFLPVKCSLSLAPLLFVRPGELQKAEWAEFDFESAEWRIPAAKMKMKQRHIVPLARQALVIFEELRTYTRHGRFFFPSVRTESKLIALESMLVALRSMGFTKEEMTVHGFRGMVSTLLCPGSQHEKLRRQQKLSEECRRNIGGARVAWMSRGGNGPNFNLRNFRRFWRFYADKLRNECSTC
jgi:hypothetical protein